MSEAGHIVGSSMLNQGSGLPFIWTQGGGTVPIPLAAGTSQGSAPASIPTGGPSARTTAHLQFHFSTMERRPIACRT